VLYKSLEDYQSKDSSDVLFLMGQVITTIKCIEARIQELELISNQFSNLGTRISKRIGDLLDTKKNLEDSLKKLNHNYYNRCYEEILK